MKGRLFLAVVCFAVMASAATQYALLVGINEYTNPGCASLKGCVTDANRMYRLLFTGGGGWTTGTIKKLINDSASRSAILDAMQYFANVAAPGDTFLYFQSSHGGNQALCAADANISASDLGTCLRSFKSGVKVLCVIDACNSGSLVYNGRSSGVRMQPQMDFKGFVADVNKVIGDKRLLTKDGALNITDSDIGWCTAVDANHLSLDWGRIFGGLFSYPFIQSVRTGAADATCFSSGGVNCSGGNGDGNCTADEAFFCAYNAVLAVSSLYGAWNMQAPEIYNKDVCASVVLAKSSLGNDIASAADCNLAFDSYAYCPVSGEIVQGAGFFAQTNEFCVGNSALSCSTPLSEFVCVLETTVTVGEGGTIAFQWKTSSDIPPEAKAMRLLIDGEVKLEYSGDAWQRETVPFIGAGAHRISWEYRVDEYSMTTTTTVNENCCYIDGIEFTADQQEENVSSDNNEQPLADGDQIAEQEDVPSSASNDLFEFAYHAYTPVAGKGTWYGFIRDDDRHVVGVMTVKAAAFKDSKSKVTFAVTMQDKKMLKVRGELSLNLGEGPDCTVVGSDTVIEAYFRHQSVWGSVNGYWFDCARDYTLDRDAAAAAYTARVKAAKANYVMSVVSRPQSGRLEMGNGFAGMSLAVDAKGKTKVTGVLPDGTKLNSTVYVAVDDVGLWIPVWAQFRKGYFGGHVLSLNTFKADQTKAGDWHNDKMHASLLFDDASKVSESKPLSTAMAFYMPSKFGSYPTAIDGSPILMTLLPGYAALTVIQFGGNKWMPSGNDPCKLKLTYVAKTGLIKGGFAIFTANNKKHAVNVNGAYINGRGSCNAGVKGKVTMPMAMTGVQ